MKVFTATVVFPGKEFENTYGSETKVQIVATFQPEGTTEKDEQVRVKGQPGTAEGHRLLALKRGARVAVCEKGTYKGKPYYDLVEFSPLLREAMASGAGGGQKTLGDPCGVCGASPGENGPSIMDVISHKATVLAWCYRAVATALKDSAGVELPPSEVEAMAVSLFISLEKRR